jgi:predicted RNA-binding Zn-ribbon protein involved in translation (DUF1610 family)
MEQESLYETVWVNRRCPECGEPVEELERDSSSGRYMYVFTCSACSWYGDIDLGIALWKVYSIANEEQRKAVPQHGSSICAQILALRREDGEGGA